jgi:hypothetical protein
VPLRRRIRRTRSGRYRFHLDEAERAVLRSLLPQLRELLTGTSPDDPRLRRLFPPAYVDDPAKDAEFARFMHEELVSSRLAALDAVEASMGADELSEDELLGWMRAVNDVRLVLGTLLDVREDEPIPAVDLDDPEASTRLLYHALSGLLEEIVDALGG